MLLSLFHTCASKQHHYLHDRESPVLSPLIYQWKIFIIELGLYIPMMGFLKNALGLREQASWMHTHQFLLLSFDIFIALVHPLHGNPYSLTLISIDGHLHSTLIRLVDVRLYSPHFCLLHNHHSITPIVLYPWLTLMYCVKIEKVLKNLEYETIAWLVIGVVHDLNTLCGEDRAQPDYMILQG